MQILLHAVAIHLHVALKAVICLCHLPKYHGASVIVQPKFSFPSVNHLSRGWASLVSIVTWLWAG
jgi:hypothetical protein